MLTEPTDHSSSGSLLVDVANAVTGAQGVEGGLLATARHGQWNLVQLWLPTEDGQHLACSLVTPDGDPRLHAYRQASLLTKARPGQGIPGSVFVSGAPAWVAADSEQGLLRDRCLSGPVTVLAFPLTHDGLIVGVTEFVSIGTRDADPALVEVTRRALRLVALLLARQVDAGRLARITRRAHAAASMSTDLAVVIDPDGTVTDAGPSAQRIFGRALTPGRNLLDSLHPDDRTAVMNTITAMSDKSTVHVQARAIPSSSPARTLRLVIRDLMEDPAVHGYMVNVSDITDRAMAEQRLLYDTRHDTLTGLLNRTHAILSLSEMIRGSTDGYGPAVLFCNIDGFKDVNDSRGHAAGDHVLREVARRMRKVRRAGEVIARLGGDEFVVLCPDQQDPGQARSRGDQVHDLLREEFTLPDGTLLQISASIGVALHRQEGADELVTQAGIAMFEAKRTKSQVALFTESLATAHRTRLEIEHDLRRAIQAGQMRMVYQPVLDIATGMIIGSEALMRWKHPTRGEIPPGSFIGMAEDIGVISELGEFALHGALRQQRGWMDELGDDAPRFVAVNVSAVQLAAPGFIDLVRGALARSRVPASGLTLEITESALLLDTASAADTLRELSAMGCSLDIDDFGTGYSSLAYLVTLPVHALKIDRSFVWGLGTDSRMDTTVLALLGLAQKLGLEAVAEGVENQAQLDWLRQNGCQMAQGYFMSKGISGGDFGTLIARRPRW